MILQATSSKVVFKITLGQMTQICFSKVNINVTDKRNTKGGT
jgi:hypothetical protein